MKPLSRCYTLSNSLFFSHNLTPLPEKLVVAGEEADVTGDREDDRNSRRTQTATFG
ncbi:hypothetical protein Hdeb2414_s0313g00864741 [Helianthus debilis subsp. tardiflorus]